MVGQPTVAGDISKHDGSQLAFGGGVILRLITHLSLCGLGSGLTEIDDARIFLMGSHRFFRRLRGLFDLCLCGLQFALKFLQFFKALTEFILFFGQFHFLFRQRGGSINAT